MFATLASACSSGPSSKVATTTSPDLVADLVLVGGDVWTLSSEQPKATAIAVAGDRIVFVGDDDGARALVGGATTVIELGGRSVTPGLIDSHAHLYGLGVSLENIQLRGVASAESAAKRVAAAAQSSAPKAWIVGRGWDQNLWTPAEFPHRKTLDAAVGDKPVALRRVDGHALWASSAALALAGITDATKDPSGGTIVRDAKGEATGVFIDNAMSLIESKIPPPSKQVIRRRILLAAAAASAVGLTGVHEMGISKEVATVYRELAEDGELPLRVYAFLSGSAEALSTTPETDKTGAEWFVVRAFKLYADGALGSRGARLSQPYADANESSGLWVTKPPELKAQIAAGTAAGWQIGVHAIGDAANHEVLNAFESALAGKDSGAVRHRIEHAQILATADLGRFASLGIIASMQPTHATSDMPWAEARVGAARIEGAYAWRRLLSSGALIASGSDFPVEKVSPLLGLWASTTRRSESGEPQDGWRGAEKMTLEEALAGFSRAGAYASFSEKDRGQLTVGRLADLTVYDAPITVESLLELGVSKTIVGGRVVYNSN